MSKIPVVTINTEYVQLFLTQNNISGAEFGRKLGYSDNWWSSVLRKKHVKPNVARLICDMYLLDYNELVVKTGKTASGAKTPDDLPDRLERIEAKLDRLLTIWG